LIESNDPSRARWRSVSLDDLLWVEADGVDIVYHRPSGKTHFLNAATAFLLLEALREPASLPSVIHDLSTAQGVDSQALPAEYVSGMLLRLEELGLVRRL